MSEQVLRKLQSVVSDAVEERRGIVVYSRLQPVEMDRLARRLEREALEKIRGLLPEATVDERVLGVQRRLDRMRDELTDLDERGEIRETSRRMQSDEIVWQAFEDIARLLGVE
jgi:hypothetical protein